jgi:ribosomal protein L19
MTSGKVVAMVILLTILGISLRGRTPSYSQNESERITQPEQNSAGDEVGQPETVIITEGSEQKIRRYNGALVNSSSESSSTDE